MRAGSRFLMSLAWLGLGGAALARAQTPPLQTQETNQGAIVAELTECRRSEGVLSIKIRLRNPGAELVHVHVVSGRNYDSFYVVAAGKKYFVLRDTEKAPLAVASNMGGDVTPSVPKGGTFLWWAKYPAPPAEVKKITYITPLGAPFENVPISDQ